MGATLIEQFEEAYGGITTGNNEHGAFHFVDELAVAEDYGRQSYVRRYQDSPEQLVEEGKVEELPEFEGYDDQYAFVDELAEENIETQSVYLKMENPIELDLSGERVDVGYLERLSP